MVTGLKTPATVYDIDNQTHSYISRKLKADYYTLYIGISFRFDNIVGRKRRSKDVGTRI